MLRSLEIRNYRNLRHLTIEKLGRVNLLVGKNNTGKTSVLEAIAIHIKRGEHKFLLQLLTHRGENYISNEINNIDVVDQTKHSISTLFSDRNPVINQDIFSIITTEYARSGFLEETPTTFRLVTYNDKSNETSASMKKKEIDEFYNLMDVDYGLEVKYKKATIIYSLSVFGHSALRASFGGDPIKFDYIRTNNLHREENELLWDEVALTEKENYVIDALRLIEREIGALTFVNDNGIGKNRVPVVRMNSTNIKVPLQSMGDGINRILTIILAMVNCENGYLLIDEFENGLHYSVQEKLWEIIFYLAERLNIQVFATTHSNDTIRSFTSVLAKQANPDELGKAIRLQLHNDTIRAVDYSPEELETAVEYNIEVR